MRHLMGLGLGLCVAWASAVSAATSVLPPGAVLLQPERIAASEKAAAAATERALVQWTRGDAEAALAGLRSVSDPVAFETAAARLIDAVQASPTSPAGQSILSALEREPIRVYQRHEETAADWFLPVFDVPGRAASARRILAFGVARDALAAKLERAPVAATEVDDGALLGAAIERLSTAASKRLSQAVLRDEVQLPSAAWPALARRVPDTEVLEAALNQAEPLDLLPLFETLPTQLAPHHALRWLESSAQRPALASAAVLGMGRLASRLPAAEAALAAHLGNPETGASAAAALAQLAHTDRLKRIEAWIARADTPAQLNDLALALRLEGSPAAQARLRELAGDPRVSDTLRKELQR